MSYRDKAPTIISILTRKLKPGKTFDDFQEAHIPANNAIKTKVGSDVEFFSVPTRVINAVSAEDPSIIYSIGLSYGSSEDIFKAAAKGIEEDNRGVKLEDVCDTVTDPKIAFVGSDNNYGSNDPDFKQVPLEKVKPEVTNLKEKKEKK
jgi:hypothetical protein